MAVKYRLVVDFIACDGRGTCAELFPERVSLDDWGYPIVSSEPIEGGLVKLARQTVKACPVLALRLEKLEGTG